MCDNALLICISKRIYTHSLHRILVFLWKTVGIPHPLGIHDTCKLLLFPNYCKTYSSVCRMYIHDSLRLYSPLFIAPYSIISKTFLILSTQVVGFSTQASQEADHDKVPELPEVPEVPEVPVEQPEPVKSAQVAEGSPKFGK